jgi:hypothetical protein
MVLFLIDKDMKIIRGPFDLSCILFKQPKKIKEDLIKILSMNKIIFKVSYVYINKIV